MQRDPFYQDIVDGLSDRLDYDLFELCVSDILGDEWPVVPVKGGGDAGMDGAVVDAKGEAFPLVTTTAKNAIGNLTRNLKSYKEKGGRRQRVIFATSRELMPRRKRNLEKRAQELGFTLIAIYDQPAIAQRLYRHPDWCNELLGLSGDPAPLSVVPKTRRPLLDQPVVGRKNELQWLSETGGDRLLVGQPGSGKTFLLHRWVLEGRGLFVVSRERSEIAAGIRAHKPDVLVVDDAQVEQELIANLRQLRKEIGASFSILASCWPGDRKDVKQYLSLPENQVLDLPLLTRDEVVRVIKGAGVYGPRGLLQHIVDQAEGRPGLAVTLAHMCLRGDVHEVVHGDALSENLLSTFEPVVGPKAKEILAVLSVGGKAGMPMSVAAAVLNMGVIEVRHVLNELAAGGIIMEMNARQPQGGPSSNGALLQVRPDALRHVLIRDVFFGGATSLSIEEPLSEAASVEHAVTALVGAKARGASMSSEWLRSLIEHVNVRKVWQIYTSIGQDEARWVVEHHPDQALGAPRQALAHVPEMAIPHLLNEAIEDDRSLPSSPGHPIRIIKDWVLAGRPGTRSTIERRRTLFDLTCQWIKEGGDAGTGMKAIRFALSPNYEADASDPGSGYTVTIQRGFLTKDEVEHLAEMWDDFWDFVDREDVRDWQPILGGFHDWVCPCHMGGEVSEEVRKLAHRCAKKQIEAALRHAADQPGIRRKLAPKAKKFSIEVDFSGHEAFLILYPEEDLENWREWSERHRAVVSELAEKWAGHSPEQVAKKIQEIERQARKAKIRSSRFTRLLCHQMANQVEPLAWVDEFAGTGLQLQFVEPFFQQAAEQDEPGWKERAYFFLKGEKYRWLPIQFSLTHPDLAGDLLGLVLSRLDGYAQAIGTLCLRGEIAEKVTKQLLEHESADVRKAVAEGEWQSDPTAYVRPMLARVWKTVIIDDLDRSSVLPHVFELCPDIALKWICKRLGDDRPRILFQLKDEREIEAAIQALSLQQRISLVSNLRDTLNHLGWARGIVGHDPEVYRALLSIKELERLHLAPLVGRDDNEAWIPMALLARDAGYSTEEVADARLPISYTWTGSLSSMWNDWVSRFQSLESHANEEVRSIGKVGRRIAEERVRVAKEREHRQAVYGI